MHSFSYLEPVCCSMSSSNCCFLTSIYIFQEAGQVVWYSHIFQNFPQFVVIHRVKGFGVVNKAEVDVFLEFSYFFYNPVNVGNLISAPLSFPNPSWTSGSSQFMYCWSLAWRILSITLVACEMSAVVYEFQHCLALPVLGLEWKLTFSSPVATAELKQLHWNSITSTSFVHRDAFQGPLDFTFQDVWF